MSGSKANSRPSSNTLTTVFERRMIRAAYAAVRAVVANGGTAYAHSVHRGPERPVVLIVVDFTRMCGKSKALPAVTPSGAGASTRARREDFSAIPRPE